MLQVNPVETHPGVVGVQAGALRIKKKPYEAYHPHSHHHRRIRAEPMTPTEPVIQIIETCNTPDPEALSNPNDPFEKHFLAAAMAQTQPQGETKIRSSSFRNDRPKPHVSKRETDLTSSGNYSSSPNLLFPKDDSHVKYDNRVSEPREPLRRVRSFKTTSKGVINRGDSFRKRNSSRNLALGSTNGHDSPMLAPATSQHSNFDFAPKAEEPPSSYFKVQILGPPGCGKTSIANQFMSSDYANVYDSMNTDEVERTVTIQLDGEEFTMEFIDVLPWDDSDNYDTTDHDIELSADAYVVVYAVIDRTTFDAAVQSVYKLRHGLGTDRPIVLVGNKIDLVRKRKVKKEDIRSISRTYDCLPFETSAALNHHIDELLVAILKQIRHKLNPDLHPSPNDHTELEMRRRDKRGPGGFLGKLYRRLSRKGRPKT